MKISSDTALTPVCLLNEVMKSSYSSKKLFCYLQEFTYLVFSGREHFFCQVCSKTQFLASFQMIILTLAEWGNGNYVQEKHLIQILKLVVAMYMISCHYKFFISELYCLCTQKQPLTVKYWKYPYKIPVKEFTLSKIPGQTFATLLKTEHL